MKKMSRLLIILLVTLCLFHIACSAHPNPAMFYNDTLIPLLIEFENKNELAASTPRGSLTPVITDMVDSCTQIQLLVGQSDVPECASESLPEIASACRDIVHNAEEFVSLDPNWDQAAIENHDHSVSITWNKANTRFYDAIDAFQKGCYLINSDGD